VHRDGDRLVIEPVRKRGLVALLKSMKPPEERLHEVDDPYYAVPGAFARVRSFRN
jgi:antitoxin VapB